MCGIAGVLGPPGSPMQWSRVLDRQVHRGPDDSGVLTIAPFATLGHTRLSILDLSHAGHQPMTDPAGRFTITFNGEIYNYVELRKRAEARGWQFRSSSDTEVLLACWAIFGEGILDDLNGMFAFCVVDRENQVAWLVRDRFGVKPLYFRISDGRVEFASMPDVLATEAGRICLDRSYVSRGLATGGHDSHQADSAFSGISALPSGTMMRIALRASGPVGVETIAWYDLAARVGQADSTIDSDRASVLVRSLIKDSIVLRMRADVPVGLSLSGGLDSSIIAAVATEDAGAPVHAFFFRPDPSDKEAKAVDDLAHALGPGRLRVQAVAPPRRDQMRAVLEDALLCQGAPVSSLSAVAQHRVFHAAREAGITVMLGGQGADEAFMGYRKYQAAAVRGLAQERRYVAAAAASGALLRTLASEGRYVGKYLQAAQRYRRATPAKGLVEHLPPAEPLRIPASTRALQLADIHRLGLPTLLRMEDRNSMAHSIESRHPFMDYRVMEMGAAFGARLNVRQGYGKWILRKSFSADLPQSIAWARFKRGFNPGDRFWLESGAGTHLRDIITVNRSGIAGALGVPTRVVDPRAYSDGALRSSVSAMSDALTLAWVGLTLNREDREIHA